MAGHAADDLLGPDDPAPFEVFNAEGGSPFLLIGDHAGSSIPIALGDLGLDDHDRRRHIAIDIGVFGLGHALAALFDAPFVHQRYSRLVVDCNRDPAHDEAFAALSDGTRIPGNERLDDAARAARVAAIHAPYHAAVAAMIGDRIAAGRMTILLSLHSFTPHMGDVARPWHIGVMYAKGRTDFARAIVHSLNDLPGIIVGDNAPYQMDATDYSVPLHAFPALLPYAELEVRQDLIGSDTGQSRWAAYIADAALSAIRHC